jgi:hypothetical protein
MSEWATVAEWAVGEVQYKVVRGGYGPHHCGYASFPKRPTKEEGYRGILTYVPVHGGITFAEEQDGRMVYGFDCDHYGDEDRPELKDLDWLRRECARMALGIQVAAKYEDAYLVADARGVVCVAVVDAYLAEMKGHGVEFDLKGNFGALLTIMSGKT